VYESHLDLLAGMTSLTSLALAGEEGSEGGIILAPLPAALLGLPRLKVG
jgi:hypothetical protein